MHPPEITLTQHAILAYAIHHTEGKIEWFPGGVKGGARKKVLDSLFHKSLITCDGSNWFVSDEGYEGMGCGHLLAASRAPQETPAAMCAPEGADPEIEATVAAAEATWATEKAATKPRTREHSKQATVIQLLQRPEGATIAQVCESTGWQSHTVRGTFANALKKKLGLAIVSDKAKGGERVYRIA